MNSEIASRIIAEATTRADAYVIDYEHQSLKTPPIVSPAAGWFRRLSWVDHDGLYVEDATWTETARAMVESNEYRYISPVFEYDARTGEVQKLIGAAITNLPGVDGLTDLALLSSRLSAISATDETKPYDRDELQSVEHYNRVFGPFGTLHPKTDMYTAAMGIKHTVYLKSISYPNSGD